MEVLWAHRRSLKRSCLWLGACAKSPGLGRKELEETQHQPPPGGCSPGPRLTAGWFCTLLLQASLCVNAAGGGTHTCIHTCPLGECL